MTDKLRSRGCYGPTYTSIKKRFHQKLDERPDHLDPQAGTAAESLTREEVQRVGCQALNDNKMAADKMKKSLRAWEASTGARNDDSIGTVMHDFENPRPYMSIGAELFLWMC